ncbi:MAG: AhpC/TSA family protein [Cytophagales bacterium]|nr:AhpC/TSA family protein [Cytophagales bacterium]
MKNLLPLSFILFSLMVSAQSPGFGITRNGKIPEGLTEGTMAPNFSGTDQNGTNIQLSEQLKKGSVVLIFYRGYWCPVCNRYLSKFQEDINLILEKGSSVIAITPEQNDGVEKTVNKGKISFSVLTDTDYSIMDQYKVRFLVTDKYSAKINNLFGADIATNNGDDKPYLPIPATYIIGMDGRITKVFFDLNYKNRPPVGEIVKYLK